MARKPKWDPTLEPRLRELAAQGMTRRQAADALGIDYVLVANIDAQRDIGFTRQMGPAAGKRLSVVRPAKLVPQGTNWAGVKASLRW